MLRSLTITNLRGLRAVTLGPLQRVNLIAGRNNVGKTSALEAVFLLMGATNPQLALTLSAIRGIDRFESVVDDVWGWLFTKKNLDAKIGITGQFPHGKAHLSMRLDAPTKPVPHGNGKETPNTGTTAPAARELVLDFKDTNTRKWKSRIWATSEGLKHEAPKHQAFPSSVFLGSKGRVTSQDVMHFSRAQDMKHSDVVLNAVRLLDPRIQGLSIGSVANIPQIRADVEGMPMLMPLGLLGGGVGWVVAVLSAIVASPGGCVMVDEIDKEIHHEALPAAWAAFAAAARKADVQVFATTHSWECIRAAHTAFLDDGEYDFALHRLDRDAKGEVRTVTYDKKSLTTSVEQDIEVRG